ncbi:hypothetical protein HC749_08735 [Arthrobacter sp. S13_S34]|nr:hypothetical protein [Arthrobacter sp. S13_S34]
MTTLNSNRDTTDEPTVKLVISDDDDREEQLFVTALDQYLAHIRNAEPTITSAVSEAVPSGAILCRLETRFKTLESLDRKARKVRNRNRRAFSSAATPEVMVRLLLVDVDDALRYSVLSSPFGNIVADARSFLHHANNGDFLVTRITDMYHPASRYKGLHANMDYSDHSEKIVLEVQFHSEESLLANANTHLLYEDFRVCKDPARRVALHDEIQEHYRKVPDIDTGGAEFPVKVNRVVFERPTSASAS